MYLYGNERIDSIGIVLKSFVKILYEKASITQAEAQNIKQSVQYISKNNNFKSGQNNICQFEQDVKIIYTGLETLIEKLDKQKEHLSEVYEDLENLQLHNKHLDYLIFLDCVQSRSFSLAEKLKYFYDAYKNLVENYQFPYIPIPNINKRIKTSNLTLFFNKNLNEKLNELKEFFNITSGSDEKIFSTWSFYENEHLKEIDSKTNNEYISFSLWFYEKQIFYPLAYHEIAHAIYKSKGHTEFKFKIGDEQEMAKKLFLSSKHKKIGTSYLFSIHEDIISDIAAYAMTGESYIHALFYTGFMEKLHTIFYKDLEEESIINQARINDDDRTCKSLRENMTIQSWITSPQFESFFTRIYVLLEVHKEINNIKEISKAMKGIKYILESVYPENKDIGITTFEDILNNREKARKEYHYSKNFTLLLSFLFKKHILTNKKLLRKIKSTQKDNKDIFGSNVKFKDAVKKYLTPDTKKEFICRLDKNCYVSLYDFTWDIRYLYLSQGLTGNVPSGRFLRLYNIIDLGIEIKYIDLKESIYELTFFKFYNENSIYNILNKKGFKYAFGPYDGVLLEQVTTSENDKKLKNLNNDNQNIFFTERHALFKLKTIDGKAANGDFDLLISLSMKDEFIAGNNKVPYQANKDFEKLIIILENIEKNKFGKSKIFISMGHENFLVYFKKIELDTLPHIVNQFYVEHETIKSIHTSILLRNSVLGTTAFNREGKVVLLCKMDKLEWIYLQNNCKIIKEILEITSLECYRLYGVHDLKIVFDIGVLPSLLQKFDEILNKVNNIVDIQIEYQPEILL